MTRNQTPEEALRKIHADLATTEESIEKTRQQIEETAQETYEFALDNFHGEQGHRRIQDFADANRISYREAMIAVGNEFHPKAPKPIEVRRELTEARIDALATEKDISQREAMVELSQQGYVLNVGESVDEEDSPVEPVEMTAEEEREMFGASHEDIERHAKTLGLSYRDAMIELSARTKEAR
ncbi:MAG: hypothetical protein H0T57_15965 [Rubrobacter sp.]|nr:hypothetical protein [Rubrobacter sp.]